jgi:hypothetical protein
VEGKMTTSNTNVNAGQQNQQLCQAKSCYRQIRCQIDGFCLCDIHSINISQNGYRRNKLPGSVISLLLNLQDKKAVENATIEKFRLDNEIAKKRGIVILCKMDSSNSVPTPCNRGFLRIFVSCMIRDRIDEGYVCKDLTPRTLGPVYHGQPGLPVALTLENFNYGNMCFQSELDEHGEPSEMFKEYRQYLYKKRFAHGYKLNMNEGKPKFFVWINKDGEDDGLEEITYRQIYCTMYERLVCQTPDFQKLKELVEIGTNLQLCIMADIQSNGSLESDYLDPSVNFGYEYCLYTMLTLKNPDEYPWRKYKTIDV